MRLLIIEDHHLIREMLVFACRQAHPNAQIGEAATAKEGMQQFAEFKPDLILLDISLPDGDGITLAQQFRQANSHVRMIVLSSSLNEYTLHRAQFAGINGFIDKGAQSFSIVKDAIAAVLENRLYLCSLVQETHARMRESSHSFCKVLSNREMELLVQIGRGHSNEEIGSLLGLSTTTVRNHRQNIMAKLGLNSTTQLLRYAAEKGFTQAPDGPLPTRSASPLG